MRRAITWAPLWNPVREGLGLEHLLLGDGEADGLVLAFDEQGRPFRLAYAFTWSSAWQVQEARLSVTTEQGARSLVLRRGAAGGWHDAEGRRLADLDGCSDVDVWPT